MNVTPEESKTMNNAKAIAAATAQLVDTDQTAPASRTRNTETGAGNQQRARADQPTDDGAREHTEAPRTWTTKHSFNGESITVTCMTGCRLDHATEIETSCAPEDIYCISEGNSSALTVPVDKDTGTPENFSVLSGYVQVDPFSARITERLPYAMVEILDQNYIGPLDPDTLAGLIDLLAERVDGLRAVHTELVRTRAEYIARRAVAA